MIKGRSTSSAEVANNLYERHQAILQKKQKARNEEEMKYSQLRKQTTKANNISEKIVKASRLTKINEIFSKLDDDGDEEISITNINLSAFNAELMDIFKPLLAELEQLSEPLNRLEFVEATTRLYDQLNQKDKNAILRFGKANKESDY